ncbi:hypothetical protein [Buchananella hordeovulneris]|uniref:hypothetical protein n=1 Tax=Buchananella hordeovulneris TaxID=52770 RepID=UPI000F5ED7F5|nr:hypothetical protein [Buchananella hordeovulneris]RRD42893.1 hypothetical protein EII13_08770 [Buchananella hordeovulneris]
MTLPAWLTSSCPHQRTQRRLLASAGALLLVMLGTGVLAVRMSASQAIIDPSPHTALPPGNRGLPLSDFATVVASAAPAPTLGADGQPTPAPTAMTESSEPAEPAPVSSDNRLASQTTRVQASQPRSGADIKVPLRLDITSLTVADGATLLNFSVQLAPGEGTWKVGDFFAEPGRGDSTSGVKLVADSQTLTPRLDGDGNCYCSSQLGDLVLAAGEPQLFFASYPALPPHTTHADVHVPGFAPLTGVPVQHADAPAPSPTPVPPTTEPPSSATPSPTPETSPEPPPTPSPSAPPAGHDGLVPESATPTEGTE